MKFRVCPRCGCNLDFGERCDCEKKKPEKEVIKIAEIKADQNRKISHVRLLA